jgi:hypothetical protein
MITGQTSDVRTRSSWMGSILVLRIRFVHKRSARVSRPRRNRRPKASPRILKTFGSAVVLSGDRTTRGGQRRRSRAGSTGASSLIRHDVAILGHCMSKSVHKRCYCRGSAVGQPRAAEQRRGVILPFGASSAGNMCQSTLYASAAAFAASTSMPKPGPGGISAMSPRIASGCLRMSPARNCGPLRAAGLASPYAA